MSAFVVTKVRVHLPRPLHRVLLRRKNWLSGKRNRYRRLDLRAPTPHDKLAVFLQGRLNRFHHALGINARVLQARVVQDAF